MKQRQGGDSFFSGKVNVYSGHGDADGALGGLLSVDGVVFVKSVWVLFSCNGDKQRRSIKPIKHAKIEGAVAVYGDGKIKLQLDNQKCIDLIDQAIVALSKM